MLYCTFSEGNNKDTRILELETNLARTEKDCANAIVRLNKKMADLTSAHDFQLSNMKLKLEAAQVKIREMADFAIKKKAIEDENTLYVYIIIILLSKNKILN
jgi:hypothetical protein